MPDCPYRLMRALFFVLALSTLGGCAISRDGPAERSISEQTASIAGFTLVEVTAQRVADYRVAPPARDMGGTAGIPPAPAVSLAPGDVLRVRISETKEGGIFAPLALGGTVFDAVRVDSRGTISLPHAGRIKVSGLGPMQVEDRIRDRLKDMAFEPQVQVEITSERSASVLVSGEVKSPGRFSMIDSPLTLVDAIARAGGPTRPPYLVDVVIRRGQSVTRIPLDTVMDGANRTLKAGDEVLLQANAQAFNALGAVKKTGQMEFPKSNPSLMDALAQAGGLEDGRASAAGVFVFRLREPRAWRDAAGKWQEGAVIFRFDMSKPETMFIAQAFGMRNNDTIYVTNAPATEWVKTLQPIAMTLATVSSSFATQSALQNQLLSGN